MPSLIMFLSGVGFGFIIGAVVIDTMYARMLRAAAVQPFEQSRDSVDLFPCDYTRNWSRFE